LPHRLDEVSQLVASWPVRPEIVTSEAEKFSAFRRARVALAASGTVTLELALAQVPMVAGYKVSAIEAPIARRVIRSHSVIMPNLFLGENVVPEFHQEECTPEKLTAELLPLFEDGPARQRQLQAFDRIEEIISIGGEHPADRAARVALETLARKRKK
jgi:lipid-A-disaccharide synthase